MLSNRVLTIRVSGKERKEEVRKLLFDLAHFKNLLILFIKFIKRYKELYGYYPTDSSILYGFMADKEYSSKKEEKLKQFKEVKENIVKDKELKELLEVLKGQKRKVDNNYALQQVIRDVGRSFNSYRNAYKAYLKELEKFKGVPKPPKPKKLKFLMTFSVEFNLNTFKQLENSILIKLRTRSKEFIKLKLPKNFDYEVRSLRIKMFGTDIYVDVVYKIELSLVNNHQYLAGIDLGLNNLIALVSTNPQLKSLIVSGKEIKAFNQWYNKERAKLQAEIDTIQNKLKKEKTQELERLLQEKIIQLKELSAYRRRKLDNDFHKISRKVVELLILSGHKRLYIGKGVTESKDGINIGRKNNQHFVSIPFRRLINLIKYKAKAAGIEVVEVGEAFTSKTSPLADILKVREKKEKSLCEARRIKRGLLKDKVLGKVFNADLVGAFNILRVGAKLLRVFHDLKSLFKKLCNPQKSKLVDFLYQVSPESLGIGSRSSLLSRVDSSAYRLCSNLTIF